MPGCATPAVRTYTALRAYWPDELHVGDPFRDFAFADAAGEVTRLSAIHGRVTVLAFPRDADWPDEATLRPLAEMAERESTGWIDVTIVSVGHPEQPCADALARAATWKIPAGYVVLVCDPIGTVSGLYGAAAGGHYYVLSNFLKIVAVGELDDPDGLRAAVRREVDALADQDRRQGMYEMHLD